MVRKKILLAEDYEALRLYFEHYLTEAGFEVIAVKNGRDALPHLGGVDLVLTDFRMPFLNGIELAAKAKRQKPHLPVIVITSSPWDVPSDHPADQVVEKTVGKMENLLEEIVYVLKRKEKKK